MYPYAAPLQSMQGLPQTADEIEQFNNGKSDLSAQRPPVVLIAIPNELNAARPMQYLYTNERRRDIAVAASGTPTTWGQAPEEQ